MKSFMMNAILLLCKRKATRKVDGQALTKQGVKSGFQSREGDEEENFKDGIMQSENNGHNQRNSCEAGRRITHCSTSMLVL